jgi:DNA-binding GntR family transcriptional regulator
MEHVWIGRIGASLYAAQMDPSGLKADSAAHVSIADAIEAGDGELAEELTRGHLERAMQLLFAEEKS